MKKIIFSHQDGWGEHNLKEKEIEFDDDVTEEDIQEEFEQWVWEIIGDNFSWNEKENN